MKVDKPSPLRLVLRAAHVVEAEIARLAAQLNGILGVSAVSLASGLEVGVKPGERFPMASTAKIPIAIAVLQAVDNHELALDDLIAIRADSIVSSQVVAEHFIHDGVSLSIMNLLEVMLTTSDNTATDLLLELIGGAPTVTAMLKNIGIEGQRVDRTIAQLLRDYFGFPAGNFMKAVAVTIAGDPDVWKRQKNLLFEQDFRDTTTPHAMAELLAKLCRGELLSETSTRTLIAVLERCRTGDTQLKGLLPRGTVVAHKTGTLGGTLNDVGVVTLPGGAQVVIAVFIKNSAAPTEDRARLIAEVSRLIRDFYFLCDAPGTE
jgi:beta-lactamase class A